MDTSNILGEEKIGKLLFRFAVPCVVSLLIGAFYNIVDQIFIGNSSLGYLGNAATGISFPVICIANAFAWSIGDGAAAYLSICAGRQDSESADKCVGTGIVTSFLVSVVLTLICLVFIRPLMEVFGASEQTLELSVSYFRIVAAFFPVYLLISVLNGMIRADGSPTYAMIAISAGAVINIVLDPIFIFWLDWGIKGAAIATVMGQVISFLVSALYFPRSKSFHVTKASLRIDGPILKKLIGMGGATFITQIAVVVMTLLSNVTLFHFGALSKFGSDIPISVFSIQTKIQTIVINIAVGIALGSQPILGYNLGANRMDRVKKTYKLLLISSVVVGVVATVLFEVFPETIIRIFGKGNELYREFALLTFRIYLSTCLVTCIIKTTAIFFQSIGRPLQAMIASLIRDIVCFVAFTLLLSNLFEFRQPGQGIYGILIASPLADVAAGVTVLILTFGFFRSLKKQELSQN